MLSPRSFHGLYRIMKRPDSISKKCGHFRAWNYKDSYIDQPRLNRFAQMCDVDDHKVAARGYLDLNA